MGARYFYYPCGDRLFIIPVWLIVSDHRHFHCMLSLSERVLSCQIFEPNGRWSARVRLLVLRVGHAARPS